MKQTALSFSVCSSLWLEAKVIRPRRGNKRKIGATRVPEDLYTFTPWQWTTELHIRGKLSPSHTCTNIQSEFTPVFSSLTLGPLHYLCEMFPFLRRLSHILPQRWNLRDVFVCPLRSRELLFGSERRTSTCKDNSKRVCRSKRLLWISIRSKMEL